jgi:hypothetical protein
VARLSHQAELEGYILDGMARALWVHAYMIWATEVEPPPTMGSSWEEMAPDTAATRKASAHAALALAEMLAPQFGGNHPLAGAFLRGADFAGHRPRGGTEADRAYVFGENLVLVCLGARDAADSVPPLGGDFVAPSFRVELNDDGRELSWEGGLDQDPVPNPARRMPTVDEIAQAFSYIEREFKPGRRGISRERWAEGVAPTHCGPRKANRPGSRACRRAGASTPAPPTPPRPTSWCSRMMGWCSVRWCGGSRSCSASATSRSWWPTTSQPRSRTCPRTTSNSS